jgi:ferric-dicitrate binding protein FerR (iron transport regulator)
MKDYLLYGVEDFITDESYLRYYFRENEAAIQFWTEWIKLHPEKLDIIISANNYIDAFSVRLPDAEFQKEQQRFAQALNELSEADGLQHDHDDAEEPGESIIGNRYRSRKRIKRFTRVAMAMLVVAAGSIAYIALQKNKLVVRSREPETVQLIEKYVPKGERAKITLPDGSEVELNADSKLTYPSKFTGSTREVQLTGEAFFRVQHDTQHPFHVTSTNLAVTVLGTIFNMQCYKNKNQAKVALVTGKVKLNSISGHANKQGPNETIILAPAEMGILNKSTSSLGKTKYDINEETGWRQGIVVFRNADLNEITDRFDKVYNIRLVNKSTKTAFKFNGSFASLSPEEIVKSICLSKQLSYTINGNVITIH